MHLDLNKDPGEGNLNLRAYIASLVGPRRVAHGARRTYVLTPGQAVQIGANNARDKEAVYLECWVPFSALVALGIGTGALVLFSDSENTGSGVLVNLSTVFPGQQNSRYSAVLLPDDVLFAQLTGSSVSGLPLGVFATLASLPVVVSQVTV